MNSEPPGDADGSDLVLPSAEAAPDVARAIVSELLGTCLLVTTVVGSGIFAVRLTPDDVGLQLLYNTLATVFVLYALIVALQPVSASFNPVVTLVEAMLGAISWLRAAQLALAQVAGGVLGTLLAHVMFDEPLLQVSARARDGLGQYVGEAVATAGLVIVILATVRSGRQDRVAAGVAAWIGAAYWATSSTSFANPAVTVARVFTDSFAGISPGDMPAFVLVQLVAGMAAGLLARWLFVARRPA